MGSKAKPKSSAKKKEDFLENDGDVTVEINQQSFEDNEVTMKLDDIIEAEQK